MIISLFWVTILLPIRIVSFAQSTVDVQGLANVIQNSTATYLAVFDGPPPSNYYYFNWYTNNAGNGVSDQTATSCRVHWNVLGSGVINYEMATVDNFFWDYLDVSVGLVLNPGAIGSNQTICRGNDVAAFTQTVASGGNGSFSYQWEIRPAGGSWTNISGATNASYDHEELTETHEFRRKVVSGTQTAYSNVVTVTIPSPPAVTVQGPDFLFHGGTTQLVAEPGLLSYKWYKDGSIISGASSNVLVVDKPGTYTWAIQESSQLPECPGEEGITIRRAIESQTNPMNYILTTTFLKEGIEEGTDTYSLDVSDFSESIQYFDGLGRHVQTISIGGSPQGNDIIQPIVYDDFGRQPFTYLPYKRSGRDGRYADNAVSEQTNFYQNSANAPLIALSEAPFSETQFEASPLNRVLKAGAPGENWQPDSDPYGVSEDHTIKYSYETNADEEVVLFSYDPNSDQVSAVDENGDLRYYEENQLFANKTLDEHNNEVIEYVDKLGRTVLKKVQYGYDENGGRLYAETYYIYDDFGNLGVVLPPEGVKQLLAILKD